MDVSKDAAFSNSSHSTSTIQKVLPVAVVFAALSLSFIFFVGIASIDAATSGTDRGVLAEFLWTTAFGMVGMLLAMRLPLNRLERMAPYLFLPVAIGALSLPWWGDMSRGRVYLEVLGLRLDQATVVIFAGTLYMGWFCSIGSRTDRSRFWSAPIGFITCMALAFAVLLSQPNTAAFALFLIQVFFTLLLYSPRVRWPISIAVISTVSMAALMLFSSYRFKRLVAFTNPWDDPYGSGFQLTQSLLAINRGDWTGVGFDEGLARHGYLPEIDTTFLTAHLAEEFGALILVMLVLILMIPLAGAIVLARQRVRSFSSIVVASLSILFVMSGLANVAVITGMTPTCGIGFPLSNANPAWMFLHFFILGALFRELRPSVSRRSFVLADVASLVPPLWHAVRNGMTQAAAWCGQLLRSSAFGLIAVVISLIAAILQLIETVARILASEP